MQPSRFKNATIIRSSTGDHTMELRCFGVLTVGYDNLFLLLFDQWKYLSCNSNGISLINARGLLVPTFCFPYGVSSLKLIKWYIDKTSPV